MSFSLPVEDCNLACHVPQSEKGASVLTYVKPERIVLKAHKEYTEKWVQAKIAEDPKILGLGDLVLLQQERIRLAAVNWIFSSRTQIPSVGTRWNFNSA